MGGAGAGERRGDHRAEILSGSELIDQPLGRGPDFWRETVLYSDRDRSANELDLNENQILVAAVEDVVLDTGPAEIRDTAREIREHLLPALDDPHAPSGHRNDNVIVLVAVEASMGSRGETVAGDACPHVVDLTISLFEHGNPRRRPATQASKARISQLRSTTVPYHTLPSVAILTTMTRRLVGIDRLARRRHNSLNPSCFPQRSKAVKEIDVANETARVVRFDSVGGAEVLKIQSGMGYRPRVDRPA